jgi:hypothetical protein
VSSSAIVTLALLVLFTPDILKRICLRPAQWARRQRLMTATTEDPKSKINLAQYEVLFVFSFAV